MKICASVSSDEPSEEVIVHTTGDRRSWTPNLWDTEQRLLKGGIVQALRRPHKAGSELDLRGVSADLFVSVGGT